MQRTHKQTLIILLFCAYAIAMAFFAIVRGFGLLYFQAENLIEPFPQWLELCITTGLWMFTFTMALKTLTDQRWHVCLIISIAVKTFILLTYTYLLTHIAVFIAIDILMLILIPYIFNDDKEMSLGYSILYIVMLNIYSIGIVFGRGYPMISEMTAGWALIAILDYYLFIYILYILKGVLRMGRPCIMIWSKSDRWASAIGSAPRRLFNLVLNRA